MEKCSFSNLNKKDLIEYIKKIGSETNIDEMTDDNFKKIPEDICVSYRYVNHVINTCKWNLKHAIEVIATNQ
jgi:hypothetical protein